MRSKILWYLAFVFFVFGDLATTFYSMNYSSIIERNVLYAEMYKDQMHTVMTVSKMGVFSLLALIDRKIFIYISGYSSKIVPITLLVMGMVITLNNIYVIIGVR